jgi:Kef-type K+ transport system membrane component KefB/mannitol/fructose-specific phosphotransferase system IIA component (Ntr-type)
MAQRMMLLVAQLGIILLVARLSSIFFEKLHIPGMSGALLVGILIGPYCLGGIPFYVFEQGLFPLHGAFPISPELYGFTVVASIVFLFMVGMETDVRLFLRYSLAGGIVGFSGVVVSFLAGDLATVWLSQFFMSEPLHFFSPIALFLGCIATATSVGIAARILSTKKKMDSPEGVTILAGAVIDNVLSILVLLLILGIISTSKSTGEIDWINLAILAGKTAGIGLFIVLVGLFAARFNIHILKFFKTRSSVALMGLGLALLLAGLLEEAGLAMIIGAYVLGLSLSQTDLSHVIQEKITPLYDFMVPIFFTVMGMLVNIQALFNPSLLAFGLIYTVLVVVAKIGGCGFPALFCNFTLHGALRIGAGMIPRGEIALIIAGIGLATGLIPASFFSVAIMMILLTAILAPSLLLNLLTKKSGVKKNAKASEEEETTIAIDLPSSHLTDFIFNRLLELFNLESFSVYRVDADENLYQIRKAGTSLGLKREERKIIFICQKAEESFIHTSLFMVMGDIDQVIKGLLVPFDKKMMAKKMQNEPASQKQSFDLARYLRPEVINLNLKGQTKEQVMEEMIDFICKSNGISDKSAVEEAVWKREISMSTGMQHGMAIPHGKTDVVDHLVCAIGIKKDGVDFDSLDGLLTRIIVLTVSPNSTPAPHVQFMSTISQVLTEENLKLLLTLDSRKEVFSLFTGKYLTHPH